MAESGLHSESGLHEAAIWTLNCPPRPLPANFLKRSPARKRQDAGNCENVCSPLIAPVCGTVRRRRFHHDFPAPPLGGNRRADRGQSGIVRRRSLQCDDLRVRVRGTACGASLCRGGRAGWIPATWSVVTGRNMAVRVPEAAPDSLPYPVVAVR